MSVDELSGQRVTSSSVRLSPAGLAIKSNLFKGRRDFTAPIIGDVTLAHAVTALDRLQAIQ